MEKNEQLPQADIPCSLEKGTPVFHGHKEELVRNWLFVVENKMGTLKIPEKLKISCVIPFLKPPALTATINWVAKYGYEDWDGFKRELLRMFEPIDLQRRLRLQLFDLRQQGGIEAFNAKFLELVNRLDSMSEEDIKLRYIESIKPRLRFEVNAKDIESNLTLEEAMVVAVNFENLTSERTFAEVNTFYNKSNNRYQKIIVCYICKKKGHRAEDCFKNKAAVKSAQKTGENSKTQKVYIKKAINRNDKKELTCYNCQGKGHFAKDCKKEKKREVNAIETVKAIKASCGKSSGKESKKKNIESNKIEVNNFNEQANKSFLVPCSVFIDKPKG